ncbi:MAG: hypothetical protein WC319_04060 [Candidatus Paceibacterota bacterium]|jgi:hypothetical protein
MANTRMCIKNNHNKNNNSSFVGLINTMEQKGITPILTIIAESYASANEEEWTTEEYVPFSGIFISLMLRTRNR